MYCPVYSSASQITLVSQYHSYCPELFSARIHFGTLTISCVFVSFRDCIFSMNSSPVFPYFRYTSLGNSSPLRTTSSASDISPEALSQMMYFLPSKRASLFLRKSWQYCCKKQTSHLSQKHRGFFFPWLWMKVSYSLLASPRVSDFIFRGSCIRSSYHSKASAGKRFVQIYIHGIFERFHVSWSWGSTSSIL
jgi:hypothetical protein